MAGSPKRLVNCVKLETPGNLTRVSVVKALIGSKLVKCEDISIVSQFLNKFTWHITLNAGFDASKLFGQTLRIGEVLCKNRGRE